MAETPVVNISLCKILLRRLLYRLREVIFGGSLSLHIPGTKFCVNVILSPKNSTFILWKYSARLTIIEVSKEIQLNQVQLCHNPLMLLFWLWFLSLIKLLLYFFSFVVVVPVTDVMIMLLLLLSLLVQENNFKIWFKSGQ